MLASWEPLSQTIGAYVFAVVMGLLWGSFANVCIYRMPPSDDHPNGLSVVTPGSHCFACGKPVTWYDNVPLLSYLWLRGKCRACKASFSARYLVVEALVGALFGLAWWFAMVPTFQESFDVRLLRFGVYAAFIVVMVVIAFIDLDTMLILDKVTYPTIPAFYALGLLLPERHWWDGLIGAGVGYGIPWLIGVLYKLIRKREGMGLGDAKLLALVGALLGWHGVVAALFGGSVLGVVMTVAMRLARGRAAPAAANDNAADGDGAGDDLMHTELPFGPYLVTAALFYMFAEPWTVLNLL
nr:prepilin peptidase [Kofleriaceae bacterium]